MRGEKVNSKKILHTTGLGISSLEGGGDPVG